MKTADEVAEKIRDNIADTVHTAEGRAWEIKMIAQALTDFAEERVKEAMRDITEWSKAWDKGFKEGCTLSRAKALEEAANLIEPVIGVDYPTKVHAALTTVANAIRALKEKP